MYPCYVEDDKKVIEHLSDIKVSLARVEAHTESSLRVINDHENRLRKIEARKGFWTVLSGLVGATTAYILHLFKSN